MNRYSNILVGGLFLIAVLITGLSTSNGRANGSGAGSTGAPCDNSNVCGHPACHGDNSFGLTTQSFELRELLTGDTVWNYVPGKSYEARVRVFSGAGTGSFGFQATVLDTNHLDVGGWFNPGGNVQIATAPDCNNLLRTYVEHASPHFLSTFVVNWQAPDCNIGPVKFYFAGNKVNNNGEPSGDSGGLGDSAIYHPSVVDHLVLDESPIAPGLYWAQKSILASASLMEDTLFLLGGDSLMFVAGFEVTNGAAMEAGLHQCPEQ